MLENGAAVSQVGADVEEVVLGSADFIEPERHDLHQPQGAGVRDRKLVEAALDVDDGQNKFRRQAGAAGFLMRHAENRQAVTMARPVCIQARRHVQ